MGDRRVTAEIKRLQAIFDGVDENKVNFVREHISQLAWYNVQIRDLQKAIETAGTKEHYQHGKGQSGNMVNPDLRAMIELQKLTNAIVKVLLPLVPEKSAQDKLFDFVEDEEYQKAEEQRQREYEERHKKAEEDFKRAVEQQRREREQREKERAGQH